MENLIGTIIFLIVGVGFFYAGYYVKNSNRRIQIIGTKTKAQIIDFIKDQSKDADGDSHVYHFPIVMFTDKNGIEITQKLDSSENPKRINEQIDIIYLKRDNEYEIIIDNEFWKVYFPLFFIIFGILFFGIGIFWLINKLLCI